MTACRKLDNRISPVVRVYRVSSGRVLTLAPCCTTNLEQSRWNDGLARREPLVDASADQEASADHKERNSLRIIPPLLAEVEAQQQADDAADDEEEADEVECGDVLAKATSLMRVQVEEEEKDGNGEATSWPADGLNTRNRTCLEIRTG